MKRNSLASKFIRTWLTAMFFFVLQGIAFAGIAVSPLVQKIEIKPGKTGTVYISLTNNIRSEKATACPVRIEVLDFDVTDKGQILFGEQYKHPRTAAGWIKFDKNQLVLAPGEFKKLEAQVTAPIDAEGDYWAALMVNIGEDKKDQKGVTVKLRTACGVFIHVARRNYFERGIITDVNIIMPKFDFTDNMAEPNLAGAALYRLKQKQSLQIETKLQNRGMVEIVAKGKVYIYNEKWRRVASIPLYASRNQVLPDDSRWFTGMMAQPLPAGKYKLRTIFSSDAKTKRQITNDAELVITEDAAKVWADNFVNDSSSKLKIEPEKLELKLNPGRFTSAKFQVTNQGNNTISAVCKIEKSKANDDWLELKTTDFALAPDTQHTASCTLKVPLDAMPGVYNWVILVEAEHSGLTDKGQDNTAQYRVPVSVVIEENTPLRKAKTN